MKLFIIVFLLFVMSGAYADGKSFYINNCASCHGQNAEGQGMFPKLAGKDSKFIAGELHKFKAKTRKAPFMIPVKENISDQNIKDVSDYLSQQK